MADNPTLEMEDIEPKSDEKVREAEEFDVEFDRLSKLDDEWRDYMAQSTNYVRRSTEDDERRQFFFDSLTKNETLQEHLLEQLRGTDLSKSQTTLGVGRTIAALATAPDLMERTGTIQWCEDVSRDFDVRDETGSLLAAYGKRA